MLEWVISYVYKMYTDTLWRLVTTQSSGRCYNQNGKVIFVFVIMSIIQFRQQAVYSSHYQNKYLWQLRCNSLVVKWTMISAYRSHIIDFVEICRVIVMNDQPSYPTCKSHYKYWLIRKAVYSIYCTWVRKEPKKCVWFAYKYPTGILLIF